MDSILFEDDELRVIWTSRGSECLVITFGNLQDLADDMEYFAKTPLEKLGYSSISFMNKRINWFPLANMRQAIASIASILNLHSQKILYGGSMGGYAAIKYSAALHATHVLAMCPQWSIDPQECSGWNPGWQEHFTPVLSGMGITPQDVAGQTYVLCDFHHELDKKHADQIAVLSPRIQLVNVPCVKHHVTTVMVGSNNLFQILQACLNDDRVAMHRVSRLARRRSDIYKKNALKVAHRKLPHVFVRYLSGKDNRYLFKAKPEFALYYVGHVLRKLLPF